MKPLFLDSVGLIALWNERDQWHAAATLAFDNFRAERTLLFSTTYVIAECANALSRFSSRAKLTRMVSALNKSKGLIFPSADEWQEAWANYARGHAGSPGLVDHLSFAVMRRLRLTRVFTNDSHFVSAGFEALF